MPRPAPLPAPAERSAPLSTITLGLFALVTMAGLAGVGGGLFPPIYVATAGLAGLVAYYREPGRYVAFVFWLWFFTPFVRRVTDWHHGFNPTNLVLLAPVLVTLLATLTVLHRARELRGAMMYPYLFCFFAVMYGYAVGALKVGFVPATYAMLTWVGPLAFSMHLTLNWRIFPQLRDAFLTFLQYALPVIAAYGIYQLVRPPVWDTYWMDSAEVYSIGAPIPFGFRTFGTLNTPGPYAVALVMGMLFLLSSARRGVVLALSLALVSLMLTRTRSAWTAFVVGLMVVQFMGPIRRMPRNWFILLFMLMLSLPLLSLDVFRDSITKRLQSFATLSQDNSFKQRLIISSAATRQIAARAEGEGLGATGGGTKLQEAGRAASIDNGFLEVFYTLGWPGGALLMIGLLGQLLTLARFSDAREDAFANSARAVFWAMLSVLFIGDIFSGAIGTFYWGALGFASCAHAYNFAMGRGLRSRQMMRAAANSPIARPLAHPIAPAPDRR
jgi:hypothetical protein